MSPYLSMAAFALAASISPGPVNIVALSAGARHGLLASLRHVGGATIGFVALLVLVGLGLQALFTRLPYLETGAKWAGVAFLLYLAVSLAADGGGLDPADGTSRPPSAWAGAAMQWLNPKAWLAALAGMSAYASSGVDGLVWRFAAIYLPVCYLSVGCWALAGTSLQRYLSDARHSAGRNVAAALSERCAPHPLVQPRNRGVIARQCCLFDLRVTRLARNTRLAPPCRQPRLHPRYWPGVAATRSRKARCRCA